MTEVELPIRMERLEGQQTLLAQQVKTSVDNVRNTLDNVQLEVRNLSAKIDTLTDLRHSNDSNRQAVESLKDNFAELSQRLETWFNEISEEQKEKWDRYYRERDQWRRDHEFDNQKTKDTITRWSGVGFALVLVSGAVVSGFVWSLNFRFNTAQAASERIEAQAMRNRESNDAMKDKLHQVELYLARGGVNPSQPYKGNEDAEATGNR